MEVKVEVRVEVRGERNSVCVRESERERERERPKERERESGLDLHERLAERHVRPQPPCRGRRRRHGPRRQALPQLLPAHRARQPELHPLHPLRRRRRRAVSALRGGGGQRGSGGVRVAARAGQRRRGWDGQDLAREARRRQVV
jgi:hypothetical protein